MANKRYFIMLIMALVLLLSLSACKSEENLISSELMMIDSNEMVSSEVTNGKLCDKITADASVFYPIKSDLCPSASGVILTEVKVKNQDFVHKGDLIAEVRAYTAEEIAEKEEYIANKESDLNDKMAHYDSEKTRLTSLMNAEQNSLQKKIYEEQIIQNDLNRDYAYTSAVKEIENLKQEHTKIKSVSGDCNIYAPYDGIIEAVKVNDKGTVLTDSTVVVSMYSVDTVIVYFDNPGDIYYNNKVTVTAGIGDNVQTIEGTVVGADHYLHTSIQQGKVYVRLEGEYDKENLESVKVNLEVVKAENVLVTKSSGLNKIKDNYYVYIMEDGKLKRRHVTIGGSDNENTWILQGVNEGDIIYLQ